MNPAAETARAYAAFAAGRHGEAAERATRVLHAVPDDAGALTLMGRLALAAGEPDRAADTFRGILERHSRVAAVWLDLTLALRDLGKADAALGAVGKALGLDRRDAAAWVVQGELQLSLGEGRLAADAFRQALKLAPTSVAACRGLTLAADVEPGSVVVARMESMASSLKLSPREAAELHYALAQVYKGAGRDDEFIRHLLAANARQRSLSPDGMAEYDAVFDALEATFTHDTLVRSARADPIGPVPIFVLGMPRSGTTLVERLLAMHPEVTAGGELDYVRGPLRRRWEQRYRRRFPDGFESLPAAELTAMATSFAKRLALIDAEARYVTDKTPGNFHVLGLLRVLFPEANIVHVARDPMDTCFSILQHPFGDRSPHTCDMALLGHVYRRYRRLMARWAELLGGEYLTVEYERLVTAPAEEGRRLFEHCGLEWNDGYLDFHRQRGAVRTFSASQVRRPIYRSSVGSWRRYADHLTPLRESLDAEP